ncbi:MAG: hypothetical protein ACFE9L_08490 [Candidatus Hodarchaeota archaeon]
MSKKHRVNRKKDINAHITYLERKYGREPKITHEELMCIRFIWH